MGGAVAQSNKSDYDGAALGALIGDVPVSTHGGSDKGLLQRHVGLSKNGNDFAYWSHVTRGLFGALPHAGAYLAQAAWHLERCCAYKRDR
jgi:hypothetical protein